MKMTQNFPQRRSVFVAHETTLADHSDLQSGSALESQILSCFLLWLHHLLKALFLSLSSSQKGKESREEAHPLLKSLGSKWHTPLLLADIQMSYSFSCGSGFSCVSVFVHEGSDFSGNDNQMWNRRVERKLIDMPSCPLTRSETIIPPFLPVPLSACYQDCDFCQSDGLKNVIVSISIFQILVGLYTLSCFLPFFFFYHNVSVHTLCLFFTQVVCLLFFLLTCPLCILSNNLLNIFCQYFSPNLLTLFFYTKKKMFINKNRFINFIPYGS